jgi:protein-S-isoprenylcysteine O-methyltransferase Ste14
VFRSEREDRLSRWGIGPHIAVVALTYAILAGVATRRWPDICRIRLAPNLVLGPVAGMLLIVGVLMLVIAARSVMGADNRDQLVTSGICALVRNPIYSAWIAFILPGLALFSRSWPLLLTPFAAYAVFKLLIHREDEYLESRFGQPYLDYRARVNELIPVPRFWRQEPEVRQPIEHQSSRGTECPPSEPGAVQTKPTSYRHNKSGEL